MENQAIPNPEVVSKPEALQKKHKHTGYIVAIVILAVLAIAGIAAGVCFAVLNYSSQQELAELKAENVTDAGTENATDGDDVDQEIVIEKVTTTAADLIWAKGKCLNDDQDYPIQIISNYTSASNVASAMFSRNLDTGKTDLTIEVNWSYFGPIGQYEDKLVNVSVSGVNLDNVADVYAVGFGQSVGYEVIFFLMKDGTLRYASLAQEIGGNVLNAKPVGGVDGIIRLVGVSRSNGGGGGLDVLAQRADGRFYSLYRVLDEQGAWSTGY